MNGTLLGHIVLLLLLAIFFPLFFFLYVTFDISFINPWGKMTKNIFLSWSFCPHFFNGQGVPFKETVSLNGTLSEFLKEWYVVAKKLLATA